MLLSKANDSSCDHGSSMQRSDVVLKKLSVGTFLLAEELILTIHLNRPTATSRVLRKYCLEHGLSHIYNIE